MGKIKTYMDKLAVAPNRNFFSVNFPGIVLCFIVMVAGVYLANLIGVVVVNLKVLPEGSSSPVSGIFVAIILGIIIRNLINIHPIFISGIAFAVKYALRLGIILLGLRLSLVEALRLGAWGIPLIIACISSGIIVTLYFTNKMRQSKRLGTLIAGGTGICGVTAIMAISPVIKAKDNEISYAIANITIFGLVSMLFYPFLANTFFGDDPVKAGLFLGTAIHDTAQVTGAALIYNQMYDIEEAVNVAMVTKLTRNLFIIAVIPLISSLFFRNGDSKDAVDGSERRIPKWYKLVPMFVIGFLLLAFLRTVGDMNLENNRLALGFLDSASWKAFYSYGSSFGTTYMLGLAMAGVGLSTSFKSFKGMGLKPFYIGFIAAISVGVVSLTLISLFGHLVVI